MTDPHPRRPHAPERAPQALRLHVLPDPPTRAADISRHGRLRVLLMTVPFTFVLWWRLRRREPEAADGLVVFALINVAQSVLSLALIVLMVSVLVFREQIIYVLADWLVASGIVGP